MTQVKKNILLTMILLPVIIFCGYLQAQNKGYKVKVEMNTEENGEVGIKYVATYSASYWDYMKTSRSLEHSIMKTAMERQYPKYKVTDFNIKPDDDTRTATINFKVLGLLKVDENGKWIAELDTKKPEIEKLGDNKFLITVEEEGVQQNITLNLPSSASGAKVEPNAFGKAELTYNAPVSGGGMGNILKYLGFAVIATGGFLFFKNRSSLNTITVNDAKNKKIDFNQPRQIDDAVVINTVPQEKAKPGNESSHTQY